MRFRRLTLRSVLLLAALLLGPGAGADEDRYLPVIDLHVDLPYQLGYHGKPLRAGMGQASLFNLQQGGVHGVVLPLFVPRDVSPSGPRASDLEQQYQRVLAQIRTTIVSCLRDPDPEVRFWSAFAAGALELQESRSQLERLRGDDTEIAGWWTIAEEAVWALRCLDGEDDPPLPRPRPEA